MHIVTSVDLFTMLVTKLRTSRPMEASIQDLAELTGNLCYMSYMTAVLTPA